VATYFHKKERAWGTSPLAVVDATDLLFERLETLTREVPVGDEAAVVEETLLVALVRFCIGPSFDQKSKGVDADAMGDDELGSRRVRLEACLQLSEKVHLPVCHGNDALAAGRGCEQLFPSLPVPMKPWEVGVGFDVEQFVAVASVSLADQVRPCDPYLFALLTAVCREYAVRRFNGATVAGVGDLSRHRKPFVQPVTHLR